MIKIAVFLALVAIAQAGVIAPIVPVAHPVVHPVHPVAVSHSAVVHHAAPVVHAPIVHAAPLVHAPVVHPVVPVVKHAPIVAVHGLHHG